MTKDSRKDNQFKHQHMTKCSWFTVSELVKLLNKRGIQYKRKHNLTVKTYQTYKAYLYKLCLDKKILL